MNHNTINKSQFFHYLANGGKIKMVKFHGVDVPSDHKLATVRKAEKVQTNGIKFEGGSWLMKNDIDAKKLVYSYEYGKSFVDTGWCKYQLLLGSL